MADPLLLIRNHHTAACNDPPIVNDDDPDLYIGYYEDVHGEQWIFTYHRTTKLAQLRGGDTGWNSSIPVVEGKAEGLNLSPDEMAWLQTCWRAAAGNV